MNYQEQLNPWVIHQLLPDLTRSIVMRFRRRNDAESYLRILNQMRPQIHFALAFEVNSVIEGATSSTKGTSAKGTSAKGASAKGASSAKTVIATTFVPM